jgi:RNA polymerase sigma-70 factor (ECF subfamily)
VNIESEPELIARCRRGDADAWDQLFDLHYAPTHRFVFQLSAELTQEDAEEICQETFLSVIKSIGSFAGASQLQTWIFRIAGNKTRDYRERQSAQKRGGGAAPISLQAEDPETGLTIDPPAQLPSPDTLLMNREGSQLVSRGLERLGNPCREIIELRYFGDLSYEEISRTLDLNQKTVSSRLSKCLDRLEIVLRELLGSTKTPFTV